MSIEAEIDAKMKLLREYSNTSLAMSLLEQKRVTMTSDELRTYALDSLCESIGGAKGVAERLPLLRKECLEWETVNDIRTLHELAEQGMQGAKSRQDRLCRQACSIEPFASMPSISGDLVFNLVMHIDKKDQEAAKENLAHKCMQSRAKLLRQELDGIERCVNAAEQLAQSSSSPQAAIQSPPLPASSSSEGPETPPLVPPPSVVD